MKVGRCLTALVAVGVVGWTNAFELTVGEGLSAVAARDAIRAARKAGRIVANEPVTVTFAPGVHTFGQTVMLDEADGGSEAGPVTWRAATRGAARIFGGKAIPRQAFGKISDPAVAGRLDLAVRDRVLVCDAAPFLVKEPEAWPKCASGLPGPWLYVNGVSMPLARWPNAEDAGVGYGKGWFGFTNVVAKGSKELPGAFEFPGDRASRWRLGDGVWLMGYWIYDWHSEMLRLGSYDPKTHVARFVGGSSYGIGKGGSWPFPVRRFYALNLLEELDAPGEWYLDRAQKKLYWYPPASGTGDSDEIVLAQNLTPFFKVKGASHLSFENLSFEYSHGTTAVIFENATRCAAKNCDFFNHNGNAVTMNGRENRLEGATIRNVGGTAVTISGGSCRDLLPANNVMRGCTIENYAMYRRTMNAGVVLYGCGNAIRACTFRNAPYIALSYSGNEHLIADNEFDHVVQEAGDSGCIYSGHNASWLGTIIFGNYIHDLAKTPKEADARNGVYFDDCDWGDDVIGNTFVHSGRAIFFGGGKLHGAYNNLVRDSFVGVHCDSRGHHWRARGNGSFGWAKSGQTFAQYRMKEAGVDPLHAPWHVVYPTLEEAMDNRPELPGMNDVRGNVFCGVKTVFGYDKGAQSVLGRESPGNTVVAPGKPCPERAPQPVLLKDAVDGAFASTDGDTVLRVALDESARLSWSLDCGGRHVIERSPLGVTVGAVDYGRKIVPAEAEEITETLDARVFVQATCRQPNSPQGFVRNMTTNLPPVVALRGWRVPLRDLVTGRVSAALEVCVWKGGGALRWDVPGEGERKVYGENTCFIGDPERYAVYEWSRPDDYPEFMLYPRGRARGVALPEYGRGWKHAGRLVTPWRGVRVK